MARGSAQVPGAPLAFAAVEGCSECERRGGERRRGDIIDVDAETPFPPSTVTSSIRRLRIVTHRTSAVTSTFFARGRPPDVQGLRVQLPEEHFPAES